MEDRRSAKIVIDFNIDFPVNMKPEFVVGVIKDYIHLLRFTVGVAEVSIYPINTKIVQKLINLESELPDTKH